MIEREGYSFHFEKMNKSESGEALQLVRAEA